MNAPRTPLVVIGAGYAGVTAANRLRARLTTVEAARWQVTLIAPDPFLVDRVRLHEYAAGTRDDVRVPLQELLHADVQHLAATVDRIYPDRRELDVVAVTGDPERNTIRYDAAIVAVGSGADGSAAEGSWYGVHNLAAAQRLRSALRDTNPGGVRREIRVIGGGATGVELAAELADSPKVFRTGAPGSTRISLYGAAAEFASIQGRGQQRLRRILARIGVELHSGSRIVADEQDAHPTRQLSRGQSHYPEHTLTIWAGALAVPELGRVSGLSVDALGRIYTDDTLRVPGVAQLYVAGDAGAVLGDRGKHLRMSCAAAIPLGGHAADNLLAELRGNAPRPIDIGYAVQCFSLGRRSGLVQLVRPDDQPRGITVTGLPAAWVKWWICRSILKWPAREARRPGSALVARGPRI